MRKLLIFMLLALPLVAHAQFNPDHDAMWGKANKVRVDLLWHSEGANVVTEKAGNVSLIGDSRYGLNGKWELATPLVLDAFRPMVTGKRLWGNNDLWYISTKFSLANAYSGMKIARSIKNDHICNLDADVPLVFEAGAEQIASCAFRSDPNCSTGSEYLIITFGFGLYYGHNFSDDGWHQSSYHFLANRSVTLVEQGWRLRGKVWFDWWALDWMMMHFGVFIHGGYFEHHCATEFKVESEMFLTSRLSFKVGGALSLANYTTTSHKVGAVPMIDLCYYFGSSQKNKNGLFDPTQRGLQRGVK